MAEVRLCVVRINVGGGMVAKKYDHEAAITRQTEAEETIEDGEEK